MILDNLSRAFKTQNWLAAGVEFVIVMPKVAARAVRGRDRRWIFSSYRGAEKQSPGPPGATWLLRRLPDPLRGFQRVGDLERHFQRLVGVEAGIAMGVVAAG